MGSRLVQQCELEGQVGLAALQLSRGSLSDRYSIEIVMSL